MREAKKRTPCCNDEDRIIWFVPKGGRLGHQCPDLIIGGTQEQTPARVQICSPHIRKQSSTVIYRGVLNEEGDSIRRNPYEWKDDWPDRWDSEVKHRQEARAVCVERRTYGSEGGKARESRTYPVWVTKLTLDASDILHIILHKVVYCVIRNSISLLYNSNYIYKYKCVVKPIIKSMNSV